MTLNDLFAAAQIALIAWTCRNILMRPGMLLHWYFRWLDKMACNGKEWLAKPLGHCDLCFAGQISFWGFVWIHRSAYSLAMLGEHAAFVCLTVFIVYQMQRLSHD